MATFSKHDRRRVSVPLETGNQVRQQNRERNHVLALDTRSAAIGRILALQRTAGNRATTNLVRGMTPNPVVQRVGRESLTKGSPVYFPNMAVLPGHRWVDPGATAEVVAVPASGDVTVRLTSGAYQGEEVGIDPRFVELAGAVERPESKSSNGGPKLNATANQILTAGDKRFLATLPDRSHFEEWLTTEKKDQRREILGMWDSSGKLTHVNVGGVAQTGEAPSVELPGTRPEKAAAFEEGLSVPTPPEHDPIEIRQNAVVTHTHPSGSALSKGDIAAAVEGDVAEMRAVGRFGSYSILRPATGWPAEYKDNKKLQTHLNGLYGDNGKAAEKWERRAALISLPSKKGQKGQKEKQIEVKDWRPKDTAALLVGETFSKDFFMIKHYANRELGAAFGFSSNADLSQLIAVRQELYEPREPTGADTRAGFGTDIVIVQNPSGTKEV